MRDRWTRAIHVAKSQTRTSDADYRSLLRQAAGVSSSTEITTAAQYRAVMAAFMALGFIPTRRRTAAEGAPRPAHMITERQEHYIRGLWEFASRNKDERSLRSMCRRITGVDDLSFCPKSKASALILALRDITRKAGYNPDNARGAR